MDSGLAYEVLLWLFRRNAFTVVASTGFIVCLPAGSFPGKTVGCIQVVRSALLLHSISLLS